MTPPVAPDGTPANELAAQLLTLMFEQPGRTYSLDDISQELFCDPRQALALIQQLKTLNLLEETSGFSLMFRAVARPWNRRLHAAVCRKCSPQHMKETPDGQDAVRRAA